MTTERKQESGAQGQGKEMTAEECKHTLGRKGNVVYLDCDGLFTREQGPLTTETGG